MTKAPNGGFAFPGEDQNTYYRGMSLRDWFAGMSMQGMLASPELMVQVTSKAEGGEGPPLARLARVAYRQADLLLAERDREEPAK